MSKAKRWQNNMSIGETLLGIARDIKDGRDAYNQFLSKAQDIYGKDIPNLRKPKRPIANLAQDNNPGLGEDKAEIRNK